MYWDGTLKYSTIKTCGNYNDHSGSKQLILLAIEMIAAGTINPTLRKRTAMPVCVERNIQGRTIRNKEEKREREKSWSERRRMSFLFRQTETISTICLSMTTSDAASTFSWFFHSAIPHSVFRFPLFLHFTETGPGPTEWRVSGPYA